MVKPAWKARLEAEIGRRGMSMAEFSRAVGKNERLVNDLLSSKTNDPRIETVAALCRALGWSLDRFWHGDDGLRVIPVVGFVSAGEGWSPVDAADIDEIEMSAPPNAVALEVRGESMAPVYRDRDVIVGSKRFPGQIESVVGKDCIILTSENQGLVKYVKRSSLRGRVTLRSYNPAYADLEDVKIEWAAPIEWVKRAGR